MEKLHPYGLEGLYFAPVDIGGGLQVDFDRRIAIKPDGSSVRLSKGENDILTVLNKEKGWLKPEEIDRSLSELNGEAVIVERRSFIAEKIFRVRRKLGDDPKSPKHIKSRWGFGYKLSSDEE